MDSIARALRRKKRDEEIDRRLLASIIVIALETRAGHSFTGVDYSQ
jgi:hypothetical protein